MAAPGAVDWRQPGNRRELWQRFYTMQLNYRTHPGLVYLVLPYMADTLGWDTEQRYWAAWLNANTQNPVTTLLLMQEGNLPRYARQVGEWQQRNWHTLAWDTDRKYQKVSFTTACEQYADIMEHHGSQAAYWQQAYSWADAWRLMTALPYMGRLSAWSGLEYVRLLGDHPIPDAATLMLEDASGSRSHRNGLALLAGHDNMLQDKQLNPGYTGKWTPEFVAELEMVGASLLTEAQTRNPGHPDVGYLTLESALCTFKSFFKKNRRYPNVYSDMLYDRLRWAEARHGERFGVLWDARRALPAHLRLEDTPTDPGLCGVKQNWFRGSGEVVLMGHDWPDMWSGFDQAVRDGKWGRFR